jgi:hypothetical protein
VANLTIFTIRIMVSFDPSSPCSTKLLFTELVEKLASWDKPCATYLKKYMAAAEPYRGLRYATWWIQDAWPLRSSWCRRNIARGRVCRPEYQIGQ